MKLFLSSKINGSLLKEQTAFNEKDYFLVLPFCTMEKYVYNLDSWNYYFGENGKLKSKIVVQLVEAGAISNNVLFYNYLLEDQKYDWGSFTYLILPGGDPELGLSRIRQYHLENKIKNFDGNIIAYSAGALLLFDRYFLSPNWYYSKMKYGEGLTFPNMPNYMIEVHYDNSERMLQNITIAWEHFKKPIIALGEYGSIVYDMDIKITRFVGDVFMYEK